MEAVAELEFVLEEACRIFQKDCRYLGGRGPKIPG